MNKENKTQLENSDRQLLYLLIAIVFGALIFNYLLGYFKILKLDNDIFGISNSLFAGLAFAGLFVSIMLQQRQIKKLEEEAVERREKEKTNETLKQCQYYLTEMQITFKELSIRNIPVSQALLPKFNKDMELNVFTSDGLRAYYDFYALVNIALNNPADVLLTLGKLEAFSAILLHGNTNLTLAKKIIGEDYCAWVNRLLGFISFYRKGDDINYCDNCIALYKTWKKVW